MIIRTQIRCEIAKDNKWCINFIDESNNLVSLCSIPPTNGDRTDVMSQTNFIGVDGSFCYSNNYIYNHKGNLKKLKGEKIIIRIKSGNVKLEYKK
jgi:hypothetical protein